MKRNILLLLALCIACLLDAQDNNETLLQPVLVKGRRLNAVGDVTTEYQARFAHSSVGKLVTFEFANFCVSAGYDYDGDYLTSIHATHWGGYPEFDDVINYTYEEGRLRYASHLWSNMNSNEYWEYNYYADGRLARKDYGSYSPSNYCCYWMYEYGDKTRTVSYIARTFDEDGWLVWRLGYRETYEYDDQYVLLSMRKDTYNADSVIYKSELTLYSYDQNGNLESETNQMMEDGTWVNKTMKRYIYGEDGHFAEQQRGTWSPELDDWDIDRKIVQEYDVENMTHTVTFYKKNAGEWVYDVFANQSLFTEPELKEHQRALSYFVYEDMHGSANVNQFVFTLQETCKPIYMSSSENNQDQQYQVFPNPGTDVIQITAPAENAVVRFYDLQGRLVYAQPFDFNTTIHAESWATGIYVWEIWDGFNKAARGKWVKK